MSSKQSESKIYAALGASSSKEGVHQALGKTETAAFFAEVVADVCGDPEYYSLLHADGAGTKSILAYLAFKESGDVSWFEDLAVDSLVMNLDDVACVNAFESLLLSNTIGRNRRRVDDQIIGAIIKGYRKTVAMLNEHGIEITMAGGETADVGDLTQTLIVDSTLFARVRRSAAISTNAVETGDVIVGLSSTGQASYESKPNSSMGSNGITLARHALVASKYLDRYPEILDPGAAGEFTYSGKLDLFAEPAGLGSSVIAALLSPTRTYAPIIKVLAAELPGQIHACIHCSGGGQTKVIRFGQNKTYVKDNLFECPPLFSLIQGSLSVPWEEMYSVFNMGHRMEIICPAATAEQVIAISKRFNVAAQVIGRVEDGPKTGGNAVVIESPNGVFEY